MARLNFDIEISKICNNAEATSRLAREGIPSRTILYYGEGTYETMYYVPYHESVDAINALGTTIIMGELLDKEFTPNVGATNIPLFNLEIFKRKLYATAYLLRLGNGFGSYSVTKDVLPNPGDFNSKVSPDKRSKLPKPIICFRIEGN